MTESRFGRFPLTKLLRHAFAGAPGRLQLTKALAAHADVVRLPLPGKPRFVLTHPDDIRHVLTTEKARYQKSYDYRVLREFMGDGLVTLEGAEWSQARELLRPAFAKIEADALATVMLQETTKLAQQWGDVIDPFAQMMRLSIAIIGRHLFGRDLGEDAERIRRSIDLCAQHVFARSQAPIDVAKYFRTGAQRKAEWAKADLIEVLNKHINWDAPDNVVHLLKSGGHSLTRAMDHLLTLFGAGYDTSGHALGWCLVTLAKDPALQETVAAKIKERAVLVSLVKETLRCFPTVPGVGREALVDDALDDVAIPKGSTVLILLYGTHHRADFWPDPERFDPFRFMHGAQQPFGYLPFGAGARVCIGSHVATQKLMTALSYLLTHYRFGVKDCSGVPVPGISLSPSRPMTLTVRPR